MPSRWALRSYSYPSRSWREAYGFEGRGWTMREGETPRPMTMSWDDRGRAWLWECREDWRDVLLLGTSRMFSLRLVVGSTVNSAAGS